MIEFANVQCAANPITTNNNNLHPPFSGFGMIEFANNRRRFQHRLISPRRSLFMSGIACYSELREVVYVNASNKLPLWIIWSFYLFFGFLFLRTELNHPEPRERDGVYLVITKSSVSLMMMWQHPMMMMMMMNGEEDSKEEGEDVCSPDGWNTLITTTTPIPSYVFFHSQILNLRILHTILFVSCKFLIYVSYSYGWQDSKSHIRKWL